MKLKNIFLLLLISVSLLAFSFLFTILVKEEVKQEEVIEEVNYEYKGKIYLAIDEIINIEEAMIEDESIVDYNFKTIKGINLGETNIKIYKDNSSYDVIVTDMFSYPHIDNDKEYLECGRYTKEENDLFDEALKYRIENVGLKTRAGVVEAARFLALQFPYKLEYFYENGRVDEFEGRYLADGEGRYYHFGLYLDESRFDNLEESLHGPCTWGCHLYSVVSERKDNNGLNCSGFLTWALYNAGFDTNDISAGDSSEDGLNLLGEYKKLEEISKDDLKCGDFLGSEGHIAIIIGIDDNNIYVAEEYWDEGLSVKTFTFDELLKSRFEFATLMDNYYLNDGNYTSMWN